MRTEKRQCHRLELLITGAQRNCSRKACTRATFAADASGSAVGQTVGAELTEVDDSVHVVNTRNDRCRIQTTHDERADTERNGNQPLDTIDDVGLDGGKDRANRCQSQISGDENRDQRRDEQVDIGGTTLCRRFSIKHISHTAIITGIT